MGVVIIVCFSFKPGLLEKIQAVGWREEKSNVSQISVNILDYKTTAVHVVFETCVEEAKARCFYASLSNEMIPAQVCIVLVLSLPDIELATLLHPQKPELP